MFDIPEQYVLAHCISADARMGAGIAKEFRRRFDVSNIDRMGNNKQLRIGTAVLDGRVFYLITKRKAWNKPTRENFTATLEDLKQHIIQKEIRHIAIPLIGAGLDKLNWEQSSRDIRRIFQDVDVEIVVCRL